jgi:hypothetical protein
MKKLLLFLVLTCTTLNVQAFHLPNVHVFSEGDDEDSRGCNFYNAAGVAKAESIFRQNRIQINALSRYSFYINVNIIKLQSVNGCIANVHTKLYFNEFVAFPTDPQKKSFMGVVIWDQNSTITHSSDIENKILNRISTFAEQAISSVEKR